MNGGLLCTPVSVVCVLCRSRTVNGDCCVPLSVSVVCVLCWSRTVNGDCCAHMSVSVVCVVLE